MSAMGRAWARPRGGVGPIPMVYPGVQALGRGINENVLKHETNGVGFAILSAVMYTLDLPLEVIFDTVLLPFDLGEIAQRDEARRQRNVKSPEPVSGTTARDPP